MRNTKHVYSLRFLGSYSVKLHRAVSAHIRIPCVISAKEFSHFKQAVKEYCLKHTRGSNVWIQSTSVYVILEDAPDFRNDASDFVIIIKQTQHCKYIE